MALLISLDRVNRRSRTHGTRKYTAARSLGRPSGLTECPATSFGKISLNHECQARIECHYARSWRYPVYAHGSTPLHTVHRIKWNGQKKKHSEGKREREMGRVEWREKRTEIKGAVRRGVEEKRGRFSITVAVRAQFETRYLSRGRGCNVENLLRYKAASYAKPK